MICWLFVFSLFQIAALTGALSLPTRDSTSEDDAETWASVSGLEVDSIDMTYRSTFLFVINEYSEGEQHDQHQRQLIKQSVCFDKSFRPWTPRVVECYTVPPTSMISGELSKQDIVALKYFAHKTANSEEERSRLLDYSMLVNITSVEEDMRDFRFSVTFNGVNTREIESSARDYHTETHGQQQKYLRNLWQPEDENARKIEAV